MKSGRLALPRTTTLILAGGEGQRLLPLTVERAKPVVPFGGIFRIVDFTLSNCLNSGLGRPYMLTQHRQEVVHQYAREAWSGSWNDVRRECGEGLVCLPPASGKRYRGTADAVLQNLQIIQGDRPQFVLILSGDHVYHMDYRTLIEEHAASGAALTVATVKQPVEEAFRFGVVETNSMGRITGFAEKPSAARLTLDSGSEVWVSMGVYVFNADALTQILTSGAAHDASKTDFGRDVIPNVIHSHFVNAHRFEGYWKDIGTVDSYYECSMELAGDDPQFDPFDNEAWPTRTTGPRGFHPCRPHSRNGAFMRQSIVSPGVRIGSGATIEGTVVLRNATIGAGAHIRRAIIEEYIEVPPGARIGFDLHSDSNRYFVTKSGVVVVSRHCAESQPAADRMRTRAQGLVAAAS
jgi:glucose-1-phosphate adenylyltransferase